MGSQRITGKRTTAFCRLGTAVGSHRYGVFFTGDVDGVWESLPALVPATIRGGNQLMPYMNNLCGGVHVVDLPVELYQRWVQFSSFSPVLWFHGDWGLRLPWEYGPDGEQTYRQFVGLRYALLPYIYSYSRIAHQSGLPLVRGMYLEYPDQEQAYASDQQYMFGRELLVAPVTAPGQGKPVKKEVFLPSGDDWFDYFTGDIYEGGRQIVHQCPIEHMPLFVRAGSIIPMGPKMDSSDQAPLDRLTLDVYAGSRAAEFKLYEDDGISLDYGKGDYAWTPIAFKPAQVRETIRSWSAPHKESSQGSPPSAAMWLRYMGCSNRTAWLSTAHNCRRSNRAMVRAGRGTPIAERPRFACLRPSPAASNLLSASRAPERSPMQLPSRRS